MSKYIVSGLIGFIFGIIIGGIIGKKSNESKEAENERRRNYIDLATR